MGFPHLLKTYSTAKDFSFYIIFFLSKYGEILSSYGFFLLAKSDEKKMSYPLSLISPLPNLASSFLTHHSALSTFATWDFHTFCPIIRFSPSPFGGVEIFLRKIDDFEQKNLHGINKWRIFAANCVIR